MLTQRISSTNNTLAMTAMNTKFLIRMTGLVNQKDFRFVFLRFGIRTDVKNFEL